MAIVVRSGVSDLATRLVPFGAESELQQLLADSPQLLQQDGDAPLAVVAREVDLREAGVLDLLLVNADGLPIAVEVKLERNAQARREVVAQVVDYLSALTSLTVDELDDRVGGALQAAIRSLGDGDADEASFDRRWRAVGANLRAGLARMVVALDGASPGLERIFRFLARNSELDVQLLTVDRHEAGGVGQVSVSTFLVSAASDGSRPESLSRTPLPTLLAVVDAYNASAPAGLQASGAAANYRQIRPTEWPNGFRTHYEFYQTKSAIGAELHIESDAARPLGDNLAALAGTSVAAGATQLIWDANWSSRRGRLAAQFPPDTGAAPVAMAMTELIALTRQTVGNRLQALQRERAAV